MEKKPTCDSKNKGLAAELGLGIGFERRGSKSRSERSGSGKCALVALNRSKQTSGHGLAQQGTLLPPPS